MTVSWLSQEEGTHGSLGCRLLPLDLPVKFDTHVTHTIQPSSDPPAAVSPAPGTVRYSAKARHHLTRLPCTLTGMCPPMSRHLLPRSGSVAV